MNERLRMTPEYLELSEGFRKAGIVLLEHFRNSSGLDFEQKESIHSIRIEADLASEKVLLELLQGEPVLSEETLVDIKSPSFWIIDPLDGTSFFADGLKDWSVTLARVKDGQVEMGMTYVPTEDEMFYARVGQGAFLNGDRIMVSPKRNLKDAIANIDQRSIRTDETGTIRQLVKDTRSLWTTGSTARALAYLAMGRIGIAVHQEQAIWDIAAGIVLVQEAGGRFTNWTGGQEFDLTGKRTPQNNILATNGYLHRSVIEYLSPN